MANQTSEEMKEQGIDGNKYAKNNLFTKNNNTLPGIQIVIFVLLRPTLTHGRRWPRNKFRPPSRPKVPIPE